MMPLPQVSFGPSALVSSEPTLGSFELLPVPAPVGVIVGSFDSGGEPPHASRATNTSRNPRRIDDMIPRSVLPEITRVVDSGRQPPAPSNGHRRGRRVHYRPRSRTADFRAMAP